MERLQVDDVLLQTLVTLINLGARKAGLATPPGEQAQPDLEQTKQAIDAARALVAQLEPRHGEELGQIKAALSQSADGLCATFRRNAGRPWSPSEKNPRDRVRRRSSGRLWVPGQ